MSNLNFKIENKIAIIEFDQPDSKVNVLNEEVMSEFSAIIKQLADKSKPDVRALLIASKKDGIFIAGADIKSIEHITTYEEAKEKAENGKKILDDLSRLDLITVAVINGACLGGGLELALACKYRVTSFSDKVKLGLPEVNLGIIPGFGGTQRLPRLIGLMSGLKMIIAGEIISGKDALKYGLVDRLFADTRLVDDTLEFVQRLLEGKERIKRKQKKKLQQAFLEDTFIGRSIVFSQARENVLKKSKGFYPAPLRAIEVIKATYGRDISKGSLIESNAFAELAIAEVSKNLIKVFYLNEEYKKFPWVDTKIKPLAVKKCGVVGAGIMGGGIAQLLSYYDIPVRIKDINYNALKKALKTAYDIFKYALKKKKLKQHQVDYKFGLISPTITYKGFENTDLVIEAVVEDLNIKRTLFKELAQVTSAKTILASNTSSLPIINMAEVSESPERVVGLHFFNPVHRMPLVEVIKSSKTSDEALATVIAFARRIGKVVIVVKDVPGFLINRILLSYLNEAGFLIEDGIKIERIDKIALRFGMPMGPLELTDEVGIDVGYKVARILESSYGPRMQVAGILGKVKEKGLLGKKSKAGFYFYEGKNKKPNPKIYKLVPKVSLRAAESGAASGAKQEAISGGISRNISDKDILNRMLYVMVNEAARCLEEGVVDRPQAIDIGMIMGTGFPPFRAGLLRYADSLGADNIVKGLLDFEKQTGALRFKPAEFLTDLAQRKGKFF